MRNSKRVWKSIVIGLACFVMGSIVSGMAAAQPAASLEAATPATPIQDCSAGCYSMTCDPSWCTVWYCSGAGGCVCKGKSPNTQSPPAPHASGMQSNQPQRNQIVYAKTCPTSSLCNVYALSPKGVTLVGTFDNIEGAVEAYSREHNLQNGH